LLDLPEKCDEALIAAGSFKLDFPDIALFLMSNTLDPQVLLKAIRAGAQEVLKKPLDKVLLQEAVERVSRSGAARSAGETRARSIISVFGPKGGVGTSTIAANIAVVIDTPDTIDEVSLELFDRSTSIVIVLELSVPGIRAARRALDVFERLRYTAVPDRVKLVVNRFSRSRALISLDELAEALQS